MHSKLDSTAWQRLQAYGLLYSFSIPLYKNPFVQLSLCSRAVKDTSSHCPGHRQKPEEQ